MAHQMFSVCHIELAKVAIIWFYFRAQYQLLKIFSRVKNGNWAICSQCKHCKCCEKPPSRYPNLRKQTVFEFKKAYLKQQEFFCNEVTILKAKQRSRLKLVPEEIMKKAIRNMQLSVTVICRAIVINVIAKGIIVANNRTILVEHGGDLKFTDNWTWNVLNKVQLSEKKWWSEWLQLWKFQ